MAEDDDDLRRSIATSFEEAGHKVESASNGISADARIGDGGLDAVVLDWMLPGMSGLEICRRARAAGSTAAIVMLTARDDVDDRVLGLDAGADDYVVKPFSITELLARVRSVSRRATSQRSAIYTAGPIFVDVGARTVTVSHAVVALTSREFDVLELLMRNRGLVVSRDDIEDRVWGAKFAGRSNVVDVFVRRIRRKIGDAAVLVETVRGSGYRVR